MSWDDTRYKATCLTCGATGVCVKSSDDWNRSRRKWEGFKELPPDPIAVSMKQVDARDMRGVCACGSTNIELGRVFSE